MRWVIFWVAFVLGGMAFFLNVQDIDKYEMQYYLWDKGKDVLSVLGFMMLVRKDKWKLLPVLIFTLLRFIWEPLSKITGIDINNQVVCNILFGVLIATYLTIYLIEHKRWRR